MKPVFSLLLLCRLDYVTQLVERGVWGEDKEDLGAAAPITIIFPTSDSFNYLLQIVLTSQHITLICKTMF